jgi:hypothetical protein
MFVDFEMLGKLGYLDDGWHWEVKSHGKLVRFCVVRNRYFKAITLCAIPSKFYVPVDW